MNRTFRLRHFSPRRFPTFSYLLRSQLRLIPILSVLVAYVYILYHDALATARCYAGDAFVEMKQPHFEHTAKEKIVGSCILCQRK